nr:putative ribonuclease H-like domain-containing protein [Tanacetum cinerariifolium]
MISLLVQVYVDDIIFRSIKKELSTEFEKLMHDKFQMSSMGELSFFLGLQVQQKSDEIFISQDKYVADILKKFDFFIVKIASTPMEPNKALVKDTKAEDVDVHLYRLMIRLLMYLTASRPNITFVVCACASMMITKDGRCFMDILAVKTGNSLLNTARHRPTNLVADETVYKEWEDIMERAATTASSLEAEQDSAKVKKVNGQEEIQAQVDKHKVIITEESIRCNFKFVDAEGTACLPNDTIFVELARMGTMASAIICLANNQKFIFSKYILDNMVKHLEGGVKFLMFPRFLQVFLDKQVEGMAKHKGIYVISSHTKKIFANMRRQGQGFCGNVTPLFKTMMTKIKPKRKQRQATKVHSPCSKIPVEESIPTPFDDLLPSVDEAQGRMHDADMFGVDDFEGNEVIAKKEVSTADPVTTAGEVVTAAGVEDSAAPTTTTTADVNDELTLAKTLIAIKAAKPKDKGKAKMIKPEKPLKKKDQIALDEEVARKQLAKQILAQKREQLSTEERSKLLAELIESRRKTSKEKSFDDIKKIFDKVYKRVNTFMDMDTENVEEGLKKTQAEGNSKRAGQELEQESEKKQKLAEQEQANVADDDTA